MGSRPRRAERGPVVNYQGRAPLDRHMSVLRILAYLTIGALFAILIVIVFWLPLLTGLHPAP